MLLQAVFIKYSYSSFSSLTSIYYKAFVEGYICRCFSSSIDYSKVPELNEQDLEEKAVHGHGPGGQNVNKAHNCVFLRHKPTGLFVKVHQQRLLQQNQKIARELLKWKLDDYYNGENSVSAQKARIERIKLAAQAAKTAKLLELKKQFKDKLRSSDTITSEPAAAATEKENV